MYWQSISDFLHMGGYAFFVWGSVVPTLLFLLVEPLWLKRRQRSTVQQLQRLSALKPSSNDK